MIMFIALLAVEIVFLTGALLLLWSLTRVSAIPTPKPRTRFFPHADEIEENL